MTNYEKIKAACQKANEKLMELSFGCRVSKTAFYMDGGYDHYGVVIKNMTYEYEDPVVDVYWDNGDFDRQPMAFLKILGHEPTLQDVLALLTWIKIPDIDLSICGAPDMAGLLIATKKDKVLWLLNKPLKDQSPEVLQFLADLL